MELAQLAFFQGMPQWALVRLAETATEEWIPAGGLVLRQSDRAGAVHFLLAGSIQILFVNRQVHAWFRGWVREAVAVAAAPG